jgi:alkylation response protein AidB-like acyl-CoA dehydrogenase
MPTELVKDLDRFKGFQKDYLEPNLSDWIRNAEVPRNYYMTMGERGWLGFRWNNGLLEKLSALRGAMVQEHLATLSPGVAVATLAHVDLGLTGLWLFGSNRIKQAYAEAAVRGESLVCLGSTERSAGSDVAAISTEAKEVEGGWVLNGTKAYVTNALISDLMIVTAVSDPRAQRNSRLSMFLVNLKADGVTRTKLNKQGWIPSDLTRVELADVFVPGDHLMGERGRGLQQVLTIFTYSRVPITAIALGTALGAFEMALGHAGRREIFGRKIIEFQAKAFEMADLYARMEAARLMLCKACWAIDEGRDFRMESSVAKYLAVAIAREVSGWAADLFGAASIILEHPVHKFPMDAWAVSLGEGTQDVQKLVIFREVLKRYAH